MTVDGEKRKKVEDEEGGEGPYLYPISRVKSGGDGEKTRRWREVERVGCRVVEW